MFESIAMREPALLIPIFAVIGGPLVFIVWIIAHYTAQVRRLDQEMTLKKDMLNRGMSVPEIERVVTATASPATDEAKETVSESEYVLIQKMLEQKYSGEEVERMVRALRGGESPTAIRALERIRN